MPDPMHGCPGCGTQVRRSLLACRDCWRALPDELRAVVNATWARRRRTPRDPVALLAHRNAVVAALAWYRERREAKP